MEGSNNHTGDNLNATIIAKPTNNQVATYT